MDIRGDIKNKVQVRKKAGRRDGSIDFVRGLCIISMICAHIAGGSTLHAVTHVLVWVDGSMGFVFLAGVVLGIARRSTTERYGVKVTVHETLKRARLIYVMHVGITLLALAVGTQAVSASTGISVETYGWPTSIFRTLVLALNPPLSILGLWVVLLIVAVGALWLLSRGYGVLMICLSLAIYAFGKATPFSTGLPGQEVGQAFEIDAWQFLFCLGLAIGWVWRNGAIQPILRRRRVLWISGVLVFGFAVLAHLTVRQEQFAGTLLEAYLLAGFNKHDLGPGAVVYGVVTAVFLYRVAQGISRTPVQLVMRPVELLGTKSLDSYVISTVAAFVLPSVLVYRMDGALAQVLTLIVISACLLWAWLRSGQQSVPSKAAAEPTIK